MTTDPFVAQLADLCRSERTRAKWVVVPTHTIGRTLGERLALEGVEWANLHFVTPFDLALDAAAPFLVEQGLDPMPDGLGPSLIMRLLLDLPAAIPSYFRPLSDQPAMGAALWSAIRELRMAGIGAAALPSAAFADASKHAELQALIAAYERHLAAHRQADAADVFRAAAAHVNQAPMAPGDIVIEGTCRAALPLVRAFIDVLPGERVLAATMVMPGLDVPRRMAGCPGATVEPPVGPTSPLVFLRDPKRVPKEGAPIELFHAAGKEAEVEAVLRRILAQRQEDGRTKALAYDHVEIACASDEYARLFWEKAGRLEIPVTIEHGVSITTTRAARALLGFCNWIDSNFVSARLRRLLQDGDITGLMPAATPGDPKGRAAEGARLGPALAARLLLKAETTWGRTTYEQSLTALAARYEQRATDDEEMDGEERAGQHTRSAQTIVLRDWIRDLLALVPEPNADGHVPLPALVNGLTTFLENNVAVASALDAAAVTVMKRAIAGLLALGDVRRPMPQALAFVRQAVDGLSVGASRARPGHLHVSTLANAGYAGRPFTFVVGLQEGGVFPSLVEDPVLLDDERGKISTALATSHDRLGEAVYAALSRLAVLPVATNEQPGGVCFSYSCRDVRDARETFPSWLMLAALRVKERNADLAYDDLRERLGTPETLVPAGPDEALTDAAWWLTNVKQAGESAAEAVLHAFPCLAAGRRAIEAHASDRFTEWDGFVTIARQLMDPRASGRPMSATRLERLVSCPFRYFVEHGLGIEVLDDSDPDADEWLDALQKGAALHEVFATLGREAREKGRRLNPRSDTFRAHAVAQDVLAGLRAICPPPSEVIFEREQSELLRDVDLFLEFESNRPPSEPIAFEVAFGHETGGQEPLAQAEPVPIPLGADQSFLLRGTIDRIDRLPDGSYEVIDYKTGWYKREKWRGVFHGGAMLQHALYGVAATHLLRRLEASPRIACGVYEFPSARGGGQRIVVAPPSQAALAAVLSDLFDVMADGAFLPATDKEPCRYCDFSRACGKPLAQAGAKLGNAANATLDSYRRLTGHE